MLAPETILQNRYRIIRLLGQGGMGAVYLAIDERLGHEVALKQMFHAQKDFLAKAFEREAKILARLHHRCLPKVSDHFSEGDSRYLVMQYIVGQDLGEVLEKSQSPLPTEQVLSWADSLLDALEYLHRHDPPILHRDIKPQNIKVTDEGELFLLDFGLAKDTSTSFSKPHLPSVIGYSLSYSPLEQINRERTTAETDIYAVCATLYHLLTNFPPSESLSRLTAKADGLPDPLVPANQLNPQVSERLAAILQHGLELRRENRPTATQLRQLLKNLETTEFNALPTLPLESVARTAQPTTPIISPGSSSETSKNMVTSQQFPSRISQPAATGFYSQTTSPHTIPTHPTESKSKSKRNLLLFGAAFVLFFLTTMAVGYIGYVNYFPQATPKPTPLPSPTAAITPAVTPTVNPSTPTSANTDNSNTKKVEVKPVPKTPNPGPKTPGPKTSTPKPEITKPQTREPSGPKSGETKSKETKLPTPIPQ